MARTLLFILISGFFLTSCTREVKEKSRINIKFPAQSSSFKAASRLTSFATKWQLADPTAPSDINCYAVAVRAPGAGLKTNSCYDISGNTVMEPEIIAGGFNAGSTQTLEVPSGSARDIYLVGFQTSAGYCNAKVFEPAHSSAPYVLTKVRKDLEPGTTEVTLEIPAALDNKMKFEDCSPLSFGPATPAPASLTITSISPGIASPGGGMLMSLVGTGFSPATTVTVGGASCTTPIVMSTTAMSCTIPSLPAETIYNVVAIDGVQTFTLANAYFTHSPAAVTVSDSAGYNFGYVAIGMSATRNFTITNAGGAAENFAAAVSPPFYVQTSTCGIKLNTGTCTVAVRYTPVTAAAASDTVAFSYTDMGAPHSVTVNLSGNGFEPAVLTVDPTPDGNFGFVRQGNSASKTFTVRNVGSAAATAMSGNTLAAPFKFQGSGVYPGVGGTCGTVLMAGASCTINVEFSPGSINSFNDDIQINYDNGPISSGHSFTINGTGENPLASLSSLPGPNSNLNWLDVVVGGTNLTHYKYWIGSGSDCTSASYGGSYPISNHIMPDITSVPQGPVTLCVLGGTANNVFQQFPEQFTFIRDTVAPAVVITSPADGDQLGDSATFSGSCENGLTVYFAGAGVNGSPSAPCTGGTFSFTVPFTPVSGIKEVTAVQSDLATNSGASTKNVFRRRRWVWVKGSNTTNASASGTKGSSLPANTPGARGGVGMVAGASGIYLFGGRNAGSSLNDLWKYDGTNWSWIAGTNTNDDPGTFGTYGTPAIGNSNPGRTGPTMWIEHSQSGIGLFGGTNSSGSNGWNHYFTYIFGNSFWGWMGGTNVQSDAGLNGGVGAGGVTYIPSGRYEQIAVDGASKVYIFAGLDAGVMHSDFWSFEKMTGVWTWIKGSALNNQYGVYGSLQTAAGANMPGSRYSGMMWEDSSGNVWLFGGEGLASAGGVGLLNDVWKFNGTNWAWMAGSNAINQTASYGDVGVENVANTPGARRNAYVWAEGNTLWLYGGSTIGGSYKSDLWKFNTVTYAWTYMGGPTGTNDAPVWGTVNSAALTNWPGARSNGKGVLYGAEPFIFGGYDSAFNRYNDLWKLID